MTGVELLAGAAAAYLVRKLRRVGGKADAEVDRVLDEGMDALHELVTARLGDDRALERLYAEAPAGAESELTVRRSADAIAQAALDDAGFAAELKRLVRRLDEHAASISQAGGTHSSISGGTQHGPTFLGRDFNVSITTGPAAPSPMPAPGTTPGADGEGKGAAPGR